MIPVEKFLEEQENKPVFYNVFCYYDKALELFNQPVIEDKEPGMMATSIQAGIMKGTFPKDKAVGLLCVYLGQFNIKTGEFNLFDEAKIIVDCDQILAKMNQEVLN